MQEPIGRICIKDTQHYHNLCVHCPAKLQIQANARASSGLKLTHGHVRNANTALLQSVRFLVAASRVVTLLYYNTTK